MTRGRSEPRPVWDPAMQNTEVPQISLLQMLFSFVTLDGCPNLQVLLGAVSKPVWGAGETGGPETLGSVTWTSFKVYKLSGLKTKVIQSRSHSLVSPQILASSVQHQSPQRNRCSQKYETLHKGKMSVQMRNVLGQLPKQPLHSERRLIASGFGPLSVRLCYAKRDVR